MRIIDTDNLEGLREALMESGIRNLTVAGVSDYGNCRAHKAIYGSGVFSIYSNM